MLTNYNLPNGYSGETYKEKSFVFESLPAFVLTGATAKLQVRTASGLVLVKEYTSAVNGGLTISGLYTVILSKHAITMQPGSYVWDLEITYTNGDIFTRIGGKWTIEQTVTR